MKDLEVLFEEEYKEYYSECEGISMMAPSSSFGKGGVKGAFKRALRRFVFKMIAHAKIIEED